MMETPVVCNDCQSRMLDCVYGLLDGPDAEAVRAHAADCQACSTALAEADRLQGLFGRAARLSFDAVRFEAPRAEAVRPATGSSKTWLPWVIAAGILLAVGGLGVPYLGSKSDSGDNGHAAINTEIGKPPASSGGTGRSLVEGNTKEWSTAKEAKSPYRITVLGPESPTANADNDYSITAVDAADKPLEGIRITVVVMDAKKAIYFKKADFLTPVQLRLPASIWESLPAEGVTMTVYATHPASGDKLQLPIKLR
jgi:hypothetical protein